MLCSKPSLFLYLVGVGTVEVTLHIGDQNTLNGEQGAGELGGKGKRERGGKHEKSVGFGLGLKSAGRSEGSVSAACLAAKAES